MKENSPVMRVLSRAKIIAREYRALTGKPLGITGEVAEYEAANLLGLELMPPRQAGYDAIERRGGTIRKLQIKGRCLQPDGKPGQRLGRIDCRREWNAVLMVLMDESYNATEIYEAERRAVVAELERPGSKARTERGTLGVNAFRRIGLKRWPLVAPR